MENNVDFESFARLLFAASDPPPPNSIVVNLDFDNDSVSTVDFVYDLFIWGYKTKFADVPLTDLEESHFNIISDYIRAIGFETILMGFVKNEDGEITKVDVGFQPLTL